MDNIDILYVNDKYFSIEINISLEMKNGEKINKVIKAEFEQKKYYDRAAIFLYMK